MTSLDTALAEERERGEKDGQRWAEDRANPGELERLAKYRAMGAQDALSRAAEPESNLEYILSAESYRSEAYWIEFVRAALTVFQEQIDARAGAPES
jgi:hypothetical protein